MVCVLAVAVAVDVLVEAVVCVANAGLMVKADEASCVSCRNIRIRGNRMLQQTEDILDGCGGFIVSIFGI